ncbi:MAG: ABC transporter permease [Acidimicrobiales bacterium]|nr:ABC transporter permease [Acidimicrobiales bacterium]HRW38019.1 ABC transporter permease [Aquihabitans sp.]
MTVLDAPVPVEADAPPPPPDDDGGAGGLAARAAGLPAVVLRWAIIVGSTLAIFSAFLVAKGADPLAVLESMWDTALGTPDSAGETLIRATPLLLAALAAAVPARAGLFNLGGEGQLLMGAIGAIAVADRLGGDWPTVPTLTAMAFGGAALGALWALLPALLKVATRTNEAISSLLLNYIAGIIVTWLCFEPWKDPTSLGQAYSRELEGPERFPVIWGQRVHPGIFVGLGAAVVLWLVLRRTTWGFKLKVLGGNPAAARRAGLAVGGLSVAAMVVGGAMAGLGGMIEVAGTEGRLRPELLAGFGFIGFLASWLAKHDPLKAVGASIVLGAIAVGGSGLKITAGLSGGAVNILMALVLFAVLGWGSRPAGAEGR